MSQATPQAPWLLALALVTCTAGLPACQANQPSARFGVASQGAIRGRVVGWAPTRKPLATSAEVAMGATVSLIDVASGNTVATTLCDAGGGFNLVFPAFAPTAGTPYWLEAVKGLAAGGAPNRAGGQAARLRTLMVWNNGWQSLSGTSASSVTVCAATTAVAAAASFHQGAGQVPNWLALVGSVDPNANTFQAAGTGLSATADFQVLLPMVQAALAANQDPLGALAYDPATSGYALDRTLPAVALASPTIGVAGGSLALTGDFFDAPMPNRGFFFGNQPASAWSVTPDHRRVTLGIPALAFSAPLTYRRADVSQTLAACFKIAGTTGPFVGSAQGLAGERDGLGADALLNGPYALLREAASGTLLVTDELAGTIRRIGLDGSVSTVAGSGVPGYVNGPAATAAFNYPAGLAERADGTIFVADYNNNAIRQIDPAGNVSTFAGSPTGAAGAVNAQGTGATFRGPVGLALGPDGNLYVPDSINHVVRMITPNRTVTTFLGNGTGAGITPGNGTTTADLISPYAVAFDAYNHLYVLDQAGAVVVVDRTSLQMTLLAGSTASGYLEGQGAAAKFLQPNGLAVDPASRQVFVADTNNNVIRTIDPLGNTSKLAGTTGGLQSGPNASAKFSVPVGLLLDQGFLYVADRNNHCVRVVTY